MIIEVPSVSPDALEMSNGGPPSDVVPSNVAPSDVAPSDLAPAPAEILVTAREAPPPGDPLQEANIKSYRVKIGRASVWDRVFQYVEISVVVVALKKKNLDRYIVKRNQHMKQNNIT